MMPDLGTVVHYVITCEHGGNEIPDEYKHWFRTTRAQTALASHRGYDPGALTFAKQLAHDVEGELFPAIVSRLLIDLNRSEWNPELFSEFTACASNTERQLLVDSYHKPYRHCVDSAIRVAIASGKRVVHLSIHSFTPVFQRKSRAIDVAWLYDPSRPSERAFCNAWHQQITERSPELRLKHNEPYQGTSDGLTTSLREQFPDPEYSGIELEISQSFGRRPARLAWLSDLLIASFPQ
jgi:predicted N-formylglutamate amidohydrolase